MKMPVLFLILICAAPVTADQSTFCLKLKHPAAASPKEANCTVRQMLNWEDHRSFWTCDFNDGVTQTAVTRSYSIGYDYDTSMPYTQHLFSGTSVEGALLFARLGLENITDSHTLKIYYGPYPFSSDSTLMFTDSKGAFHTVDFALLKYGACGAN